MKLSTKARYGLRLMVVLAAHYGEGPLGVDSMSREEDISPNYIRVLLGGLKSAGLVRSLRGVNGGYQLAQNPSEVTAFDVIAALEEEILPVSCVPRPEVCSRRESCSTWEVWCEIASSVDDILKGLTLQDLVERQKRSRNANFPAEKA
jgi:Rrf2 family protein